MEPPPCIQNAMLTKDKKPFTYTPGGLNLSEIRSPRMARRIERNAAYEGVGTPPPQPNRVPFTPGSLPPSAVAAMQPQMHVQVFPTGPPQSMNQSRHGVPPPPPPPPSGGVPPPPPPMQPLPTQKIRAADQTVVERPDMTKIIPENPMALLKRTGGPKVKNTLLDEMYREPAPRVGQHLSQIQTQPISPPQQQPRSIAPFEQQASQNSPYQYHQNPHMATGNSAQPVQQPPHWSPPVLERHDSRNLAQPPQKTVNVGSIYIPPISTQQSRNVTSPPAPQSPKTPGTPTLKEAPKPWQLKQQNKQEQVPEWAKKEPIISSIDVQEQSSSNNQEHSQRPWSKPTLPRTAQQEYQESVDRKPQQQNKGCELPFQQRIETQQKHQRQQPDPSSQPNAVFVTQPIILQHPGSGYGPPVINRRENVIVSKQGEGGGRIVPIQLEGVESPNRDLIRQQSWSTNNPTQSGSFRIIQKLTGTEQDEPNYAEHSTRLPQEQARKMQLNNSDQELLNRFKQDVDSEKFLHGQSTDPRYLGAAIPSKAFRLLQNMTDEPRGQKHVPNDAVRSQPQVRNIPIQIEGNGTAPVQRYVPPSQQTPAEEPKKYTGSSIPSRSFKMLQAMTAPDSCANAKELNETNETYETPYHGRNWTCASPFPIYPPPPYWYPYYPPNPREFHQPADHSHSDPELNGRKTPQSFWNYPLVSATPEYEQRNGVASRCSSTSELENINLRNTPVPYWAYPNTPTPVTGRKTPKGYAESDLESNRSTPMPFWPGYPPYDVEQVTAGHHEEGFNYYHPYPQYYDPYYLSYCYGYPYPPAYSPFSSAYPNNESEDLNEYSSMDEMTYYNQKSEKPTVQDTNKEIPMVPALQSKSDTSDSDTDTEVDEGVEKEPSPSGGLQTIRSVHDINVYKQSEDDSEQSESEDSEASSVSSTNGEDEEEVIPHQLSIIFEVSERTETSRNTRACSVLSDCTTLGAKSDDDDEDDVQLNKRWISDNLIEIASRIQSRIDARIGLDDATCIVIGLSTQEGLGTLKHRYESSNCSDPDTQKTEKEVEMKDKKLDDNCNGQEVAEGNELEVETGSDIIQEISEQQNFKKSDEIEQVISKESSDSEDWWSVIGNKEEDFPVRKTYAYDREPLDNYSSCTPTNSENLGCVEIKENESEENVSQDLTGKTDTKQDESNPKLEATSAHSSDSSASSRKVSNADSAPELNSDSSSSSECEESDSGDEEEAKHDINNNEEKCEEPILEIPSIKDRIRALQESISAKKKSLASREDEIKSCVKTASSDKGEISRSKIASAKSSVKSFDEISEEDSGVTDMSRQYSDNEDFPELKKMTRCQRASTHSRLFELLQEECDNEDLEDNIGIEEKKAQLTLDLTTCDKLVDELVQSMLKQKKGQIFRNMSMDKLHAAAKKILQEESNSSDNMDTPSEGFSEFLSPLRNDTGNSTPQEFYGHYNEYMQYYDSWAQAAVQQNADIVPSKTFKMIQDVSRSGGNFAPSQARCPRVLSGKNVHSDLIKLVECPEETAPLPNTKS